MRKVQKDAGRRLFELVMAEPPGAAHAAESSVHGMAMLWISREPVVTDEDLDEITEILLRVARFRRAHEGRLAAHRRASTGPLH